MYIRAASAEHGLVLLIRAILKDGHKSSPRHEDTVELSGLTLELSNPRNRIINNTSRGVKMHYAAASVAWNLAGRHDVDGICYWNENGRDISDDGITFHGANYGERWQKSLWQDIALIQKTDLETRRAWVQIYDQTIDGGVYTIYGKDVPCTIGFGLHIVNGRLEMETVMRSQSVVGVLPYDLFLFTAIHELIANQLGVALGTYRHHMISSHIYVGEISWAEKIVKSWESGVDNAIPMNPIPYTLTQATERWPQSMQDLQSGVALENPDAIESMMREFITSRQ